MLSRLFLIVIVSASISSAHAQTAPAQSYPSKPVRLIVPFGAGGVSDVSARIVAQRLSERWAQQVVVENRPGAGGTIGTALAAKAAPDGYTLLFGSSTEMVENPHLYRNLSYDTVRDFAPISHVASSPLILVVHPSVAASSVPELIALAKARPNQLNVASSGNGSTLHLAQVLFENAAQVQMVHVPYTASPQAALGTVAGDTQVNFGTVPAVLEHVRSGRLRGLAVTSSKRSSVVPDLPTISEAAIPDYEILIWTALFAPRGTPNEIIARVHADVAAVLQVPQVREAFARLGAEVSSSTPEQLSAYVASNLAKMAKVVAASGVKIE